MLTVVFAFLVYYIIAYSMYLNSVLMDVSLQDWEAVWAHFAAPESGDDHYHVCNAPPLLQGPKHQPGEHQTAPTFR